MKKITLVDLNNFAHYPTLPIGYIIAYLRASGLQVELLSPFNSGVVAKKREPTEKAFHYWEQRLRFSGSPAIKKTVRWLKGIPRLSDFYYKRDRIFEIVRDQLSLDTDLILISSYLEHYHVCKEIAQLANTRNIPVIIGGSAFNIKEHAQKWIQLEGVAALAGVEVDEFLGQMIKDFLDGKDISSYPGIFTKECLEQDTSYVFKPINSLPIPDFSDFPWEKYPVKIIPYMTARGCGWAKCNFCTDVTLVNGRTFRSMKSKKVLLELKELSERHHSNFFYFLDIKLNSDLEVWYGIINEIKNYVKDPKWICSVHVDGFVENGLDRETIFKAKASGLTRITFGLESGSQRLLNHMKKGTKVERIKDFIWNVYDAGISLRGTMFIGYPYETDEDLMHTYQFLVENGQCFDRIRLTKFGIFESAPIYKQVKRDFNQMVKSGQNDCYTVEEKMDKGEKYHYYKRKIIRQVHLINSSPLREEAREFDGVM